jgi:hypothetical protein
MECGRKVQIYVSDIAISTALAAMFFIFVELPTANLLKFIWNRNTNFNVVRFYEKVGSKMNSLVKN